MEKTTSQLIFETKEVIKGVIAESKLHVSIVELIMKDLYLEIKDLADKQLQSDIINYRNANMQEDNNDGEHKPISDGNT